MDPLSLVKRLIPLLEKHPPDAITGLTDQHLLVCQENNLEPYFLILEPGFTVSGSRGEYDFQISPSIETSSTSSEYWMDVPSWVFPEDFIYPLNLFVYSILKQSIEHCYEKVN